MGIVQRLLTRPKQDSENSLTGMVRIGGGSYSSRWSFTRTLDSVYANPTAKRCIERIANDFQRPDWQLRKRGTEDDIEGTDERYKLLREPNPRTSGTAMQYHISRDLDLAGGTNWLKIRGQGEDADWFGGRGPVTGLLRLAAQRITVIADDDDALLGFVYQDRMGRIALLHPDECVYVNYPHPDRPADRMAPALVAGLPAETDTAAMKFNFELLSNDSAIPGYVTVEGLTPAKFKEWKAQWDSTEAPGKTRFLSGNNAKYVKVGQTNQELTYGALRDSSREDICRAFGPPRVLIDPTDATFANMDVATRSYMKAVVDPRWTLVSDAFTMQLGNELGGVEIGFNLDDIEELQEGMDSLVKRSIPLLDKQVVTINEVRRDLKLDSVEWGDVPITAGAGEGGILDGANAVGTLIRSGFTPEASLEAAGLPPIEHTGLLPVTVQSQAAVESEGEVAPPADGATEAPKNLHPIIDVKAIDAVSRTLDAIDGKGVEIGDLDPAIARQERRAKSAMTRFYDKQSKAIVARLNSKKGRTTKAADDWWWDEDRWKTELVEVWTPILGDTIDNVGSLALSTFNADGVFDSDVDRVTQYLETRSTEIAGTVNGTTADDIRSKIAAVSEEGGTVADMAKSVEDYFSDHKVMRAERVARTEIIGATNWSAIEGARQSGVVTGKTWLAASDAEADCAALSGTSVGLDESFGPADQPPLHPNCRCTVTFTLGDETE